jgi:hypothetical protein
MIQISMVEVDDGEIEMRAATSSLKDMVMMTWLSAGEKGSRVESQ